MLETVDRVVRISIKNLYSYIENNRESDSEIKKIR